MSQEQKYSEAKILSDAKMLKTKIIIENENVKEIVDEEEDMGED